MTARICYLIRTDRGARLLGVRIADAHGDEIWHAPSEADQRDVVVRASEWIADQLVNSGKRIDRLCLDVDGAVCSWLHATSADPKLVRALIEGARPVDDAFGEDAGEAPMRFPDLPGEVGFQPLATPPASSGGITLLPQPKSQPVEHVSRFGVVATPDIPARLLIDELDRKGIEVGSVVSLWHVGSRVWDPKAPTPGSGLPNGSASSPSSNIVGDSAHESCTAVVLIDPLGRLVWAWSLRGELLSAGSLRLPSRKLKDADHEHAEPEDAPRLKGEVFAASLGENAIGRLSAEWLGWGAQLGLVPERVTVIATATAFKAEESIDAAALGTAIRRALPSSSVDLIDDEDPVGLTLRRFAERIDRGKEPKTADGAREALLELNNRAGKSHRGMYRWVALALVVASVLLIAVSIKLRSVAKDVTNQEAAVRVQKREILVKIDPILETDPLPEIRLAQIVGELQGKVAPAGAVPPPLPILQEFETMSLLLGDPAYEIRQIRFSEVAAQAVVIVEGTSEYEFLREGLRRIAGSRVEWNEPSRAERNGKVEVKLIGVWPRSVTGGSIQ